MSKFKNIMNVLTSIALVLLTIDISGMLYQNGISNDAEIWGLTQLVFVLIIGWINVVRLAKWIIDLYVYGDVRERTEKNSKWRNIIIK